jgi:serine protease Do
MTAADGRTEVSFRVMRVDTAVNSGNSGGGLYDDEGNLIGIVNAKIVYDGVENIGYAIPSNVAVSIADNIIDYCYGTDTERVQRALLGITVSTSDSGAVYDTATGLLTIKETVSVYEVSDGSLADGVLQAGDILVSATVNGNTAEITRQYHIIDMMLDVRAGDVVTIKILRGSEEMTVDITITEDCLTAY